MKKKKILVVLTNKSTYEDRSEKTGLWLNEATDFVKVVENNGYSVDYVSPKGGEVPIDPESLGPKYADENAKDFLESEDFKKRALKNSLKPTDINPDEYVAIYYTGGHGVVWDFPDNKELQEIAIKNYESGGYVTSVCHGVAGLLNIKDKSGNYLISGKKITGFTGKEEELIGKDKIVPFGTEEESIKRGADFQKEKPFTCFAVKDDRLITGQNTLSGKAVAEKLVEALEN